MTQTDEREVRAIIENWAAAVRRHDLAGVEAHHAQNIVMYDLPLPLQCKGMEEYRRTWDLFFKYHSLGGAFDIQDLAVVAGDDVAFAFTTMRCAGKSNPDGFLFRLTIGLRKIAGQWQVIHEHHSEAAKD